MTTKEGELTTDMVEFFPDAANQRIGQVDGSTVGGEEQGIVNLLHGTDIAPLGGGEFMTESCHTLALIALQHQSVCRTVGERIASLHPRFVAFLQHKPRIVVAEMQGVVLGGR